MKSHANEFKIEKMAQVLRVSKSGYYKYLNWTESKRARENRVLLDEIRQIYEKNRQVYGSPRIHIALKQQGYKYSRTRIARLMRINQIQSKTRKKWKRTTQSKKGAKVAPNHLDQNFEISHPKKVWASDITYVPTQEGWLYVAVVMDLFSRKIVGLSMDKNLETCLVTNALKQALFSCSIGTDLLHHSDRGCQYTSREFKELANAYSIKLSMSGKGCCYDNAVVESFFHTLKTEEVHLRKYKTREEARGAIFDYIEVFYNRKRLHSTLGYVSPLNFEKKYEDHEHKKSA